MTATALGASRQPFFRNSWPGILSICVYAAIAVAAYWPLDPLSGARLLGCACSDPAQQAWLLAWQAHAIAHLQNPLFTQLLDAPHGANLMIDPSMQLLGVLAAPVTWLRGPVAAFNTMMWLSFVVSATSMCLVVRRLARFWPAAFLAGFLYGFSPYMVGQGFGHLNLTFVPLPPLILWCLYELCRRREGSVLRLGLLFGGLCVLQYLISVEVLVTTAVSGGVVLAITVVRHADRVRERVATFGKGILAALALFAPLVAYPTWFFLYGPQHVNGPPHAVSNLAPLKADLLGLVVPTVNQRIGPAHLIAVGSSFAAGARPENGVYLGIPLLLLLAFLVVRFRREPMVRLGILLAVVGWIFSLGTPLVVDKHRTGVPLPFAVLAHLPLVQGVTALRFSLYEQLGAAIVFGVGLSRLWAEGSLPEGRRRLQAWLRPAGIVAAGVIALVPLLPRYPYRSTPVDTPAFFTSAAVDAVPSGSVMLTYPYDIVFFNQPMLWQAAAGMRFAIFGGEAFVPGPNGQSLLEPAVLDPSGVIRLFAATEDGRSSPYGPAPALNPQSVSAIRTFCARYHVATVVVDKHFHHAAMIVPYLTAAFGSPSVVGGVDLWSLSRH